jgi:hypothetical protein
MAEPIDDLTFAKSMVVKYQTLLTRHAGKRVIKVDGIETTFDQLRKEFEHWRSELQVLESLGVTNAPSSMVATVDMSGG